jgi:hypothetical protein
VKVFLGILFGFDALLALTILYFFVIGLADGSVSADNMGLWLGILAGLAVVLGGGWILSARGQRAAAAVLLMILAMPGFLYGLFILAIVIFQPRWN